MANTKKDAVIIGAGPVGSRLAFRLAGLGHEVLVLDKKTAAGDEVCCTGIVSQQYLDSFAISRSLVLRQASSARFVAPSGEWLRLWRDGEVAAILDRPALNLALTDQAHEAGADYLFDTQVMDIQPGNDCVRIRANSHGEDSVFEARTAVVATGFGSPLPERLGLGRIRDFVIGAQAEVEMIGVDEVEVYFDQALAPGGFAWLVPTAGGKGLAGLLTRGPARRHIHNLLSRLRAQGKIASAEAETGYGAIPLRSLPRTSAHRILAVGEAAGQVKPATGGGLYYGFLCADIAADTLHQTFATNNFSAASLCLYDRRWRARLSREQKASRRLLRFYYRLSNQHIERLFQIVSSSDVPQLLAGLETFPFDWHSALVTKLVKRLAVRAPFQLTKSLLKAVNIGGQTISKGRQNILDQLASQDKLRREVTWQDSL